MNKFKFSYSQKIFLKLKHEHNLNYLNKKSQENQDMEITLYLPFSCANGYINM